MPVRELPEKFQVAFSFAGEQRDLVRSIAEAVEQILGPSSVFLDEWFEHHIAGHDADLALQHIYGEQSELVVVCVSERYGGKPWTQMEHEAIRARLMKARQSTNPRDQQRILPIRVGDGDIAGIPFNAIVPDVRDRSAAKAAEELVIPRLKLVMQETSKAPADGDIWPATPPTLAWPMANHGDVCRKVASLLMRDAPFRFLPLRGPSESGKTHITQQILGNGLKISGLACGRFDFKGTAGIDSELRAFCQFLEVPTPDTGSLSARLSRILDGLRQRARPALLIFDTYEAAGEAQDWVEKQLLPSLVRADWLRVVIAGKQVPKSDGAIWDATTCFLPQLQPPPPEEWLIYGQPHKPGIDLDFVRLAYQCCGGRSSVLAQLLGRSI